MSSQAKLAAYVMAALLCLATAAGAASAQTLKQQAPAPPVERPFGGPPNRTDPTLNLTCAAPTAKCTLADPLPMDSPCTCRVKGKQHKGKIVPGE